MRTYEKTHPWITFTLDLMKAPASLWVKLGECQSKCEHIAGVPLQPEKVKQLQQIYLAKGALATTAIEGNTLTEEEVKKHLEGKLKLPPSREYLEIEVQNVIDGCNLILDDIRKNILPEIRIERIKELNKIVLKDLALEEGVVPGEIRNYSVGVWNYRGAPAEDCEYLLDRLCKWLNSEEFTPPQGLNIVYAILKAIIAHIYLALIHPFGDGNGRTARFIEFQILIGSGVPAPAAHLLSNHYNQTRTEYYRQLDRISKTKGEVLPFINYAVQGFLDGLAEQLSFIEMQQWELAWRDYINEKFNVFSFLLRKKTTESDLRRKQLVIDLSMQKDPVPLHKLSEINPQLMKAYMSKTPKTLSRDINALIDMGLVRREGEGYVACKEKILAFLPVKADSKNPGECKT